MREHKFVIVRTFINSIADCYAFSTPEYNKGNVLPKLIGGLKIADEIILKPHNGGVLEVELITVRTNGKNEYLTNERVYFDRGLVSAIEIFVEYDECRRQVKRQEDDEVAKLQSENALLRKVEEVGEIMWSEAVCHKCEARACRGCTAHDFKQALSEYQSWKEGQK